MPTHALTPLEALERLKDGNRRFVDGLRSVDAIASPNRRAELAENGQSPYAIILTCSDSRVPAELIFDSGLGDLFVVRVAGNVVAPSLIASIEFAVTNFGTPVCLVMGHSQCGAIQATLDIVRSGKRPASDNLQSLYLEIAPSVKSVLAEERLARYGVEERSDQLDQVIRRNVRRSVDNILERSRTVAEAVSDRRLILLGATYDLRSGVVGFDSCALPLPDDLTAGSWGRSPVPELPQ